MIGCQVAQYVPPVMDGWNLMGVHPSSSYGLEGLQKGRATVFFGDDRRFPFAHFFAYLKHVPR